MPARHLPPIRDAADPAPHLLARRAHPLPDRASLRQRLRQQAPDPEVSAEGPQPLVITAGARPEMAEPLRRDLRAESQADAREEMLPAGDAGRGSSERAAARS